MFPFPQNIQSNVRSAMIRGSQHGTPKLIDINDPILSSELFENILGSQRKAHSHSRQKRLYSPGSLSDRRKASEEPSDIDNYSPLLYILCITFYSRQPNTDRYTIGQDDDQSNMMDNLSFQNIDAFSTSNNSKENKEEIDRFSISE